MKSRKLLFSIALASISLTSLAQHNTNSVLDPQLQKAAQIGSFDNIITGHPITVTKKSRSAHATQTLRLSVVAENSAHLSQNEWIKAHSPRVITENVLTLTVSPQELTTLSQIEGVRYVKSPRKFVATMNRSRIATGASKVQEGEGLETPFDGSGVLVGIIDQGFQFNHRAFYDDDLKTRIVQLWDHESDISAPFDPSGYVPEKDGFDQSHGHATHVTNIAAGSIVNKTVRGTNKSTLTYYGMAPKANLFLVASQFSSPNIQEEVRAIYDYAKKHDMPCVINMSFGSQIGPHDGTTLYDQTVSRIIEKASEGDNPRLVVCAASGNEGTDLIHAQYTFKSSKDKLHGNQVIKEKDAVEFLSVPDGVRQIGQGCIWSCENDGKKHIKFTPFIQCGKRKKTLSDAEAAKLNITEGIDPENNKQYIIFSYSKTQLANIMKVGAQDCAFGIKMEGDKDVVVHGWMQPQNGTWIHSSTQYIINSDYLVGEGAASIPLAFAVAACGLNGNATGAPASFSSPGPWLGNSNKPEITTPGVNIMSALNSKIPNFDKNEYGVQCMKVNMNGHKESYYYGPMSGTSMATPEATGIIALWLQANPKLTRNQILDIIKETSDHDQYTGKGWSPKTGYGKLNAYKGLQKALELKNNSGIDDIYGSESPISIARKDDGWRILFNNDEAYANMSVYTSSGRRVWQRTVTTPQCGSECIISYADYTPGVYILHVVTPQASYNRKFIVK